MKILKKFIIFLLSLSFVVGCGKNNSTKYDEYIKKVSTRELYGEVPKIQIDTNIQIDRNVNLSSSEKAVTLGDAIDKGDEYVKKFQGESYGDFLRRVYLFKAYEKKELENATGKINNVKFGAEKPKAVAQYKFQDGKVEVVKEEVLDETEKKNIDRVVNLLVKIIPKDKLNIITEIEAIRDVNIDSPMYVLYGDITEGMRLGINLPILNDDYFKVDEYLSYALIHEFAHAFSMSKNQLEEEKAVNNPEYVWELLDGYREDSYLKNFYNSFWKNVPEGWTTTKYKSQREMVDFYLLNEDIFSNGYASTNVHEDFAESFKFFITEKIDFESKHNLEKKVLFFYQYPELVQLRLEILKNLAEFKESE